MAFPKYGSVQSYELKSSFGFKPGDKAELYGQPVFIDKLVTIPGGELAYVHRVLPKHDGRDNFSGSACNLRKLPPPPDDALDVSSAGQF